jgi:hypothetical protein
MRHPFRTAAGTFAAALLLASGGLAACSDDAGSPEAFCAQVEQVPSLESVLSRFSEADPDLLADRIAKARAAYDELAEAAPAEIEDETDQVVALVDAILDAVEEHPDDPAKASAQLRTAMADHEGVEADRAKVADYAQATCDVQLDATLSEGGATSSPNSSTTSTAASGGEAVTSTTVPDDGTGPTTTAGG